jgi:hypothetical protein
MDLIGAYSFDDTYLGKGNGTFDASKTIPIPFTLNARSEVALFGIVAADMNGDGKQDLVLDGLLNGSSTVFALINTTVPVPGFTVSAAALSPASVTPGDQRPRGLRSLPEAGSTRPKRLLPEALR